MLIGLLVNLMGVNFAYADSKENKEARFIQKIKDGVGKIGTGVNTRVEVKLKDKRKLKGYISEAGESSFVVVDAKSGAPTPVAYPEVKQFKGNNLATGAKIAIGIGIGALIGILIIYAYIAANED